MLNCPFCNSILSSYSHQYLSIAFNKSLKQFTCNNHPCSVYVIFHSTSNEMFRINYLLNDIFYQLGSCLIESTSSISTKLTFYKNNKIFEFPYPILIPPEKLSSKLHQLILPLS